MTLIGTQLDGETPKGGKLVQGKDGSSFAQDISVDSDGHLQVDILSGGGSGDDVGATGSAVPSSAGYQGLNVSGTLRGATAVNPSGSVYAQQVDVASLAGTTTDTNSGNKSAGTLRVVLATDQPQNTNAFKVDGSAVTQPVSAASLPLPTGAATSANQSTIIGHVDGIEGLLTTIDADTGTLAGAVSGSEMQVDVVTMPTVTVDSELPDAAALGDNTSNPTAPAVGAFGMLYDGSTWDRARSVAALGDAGTAAAAAGLYGYNGTNWDRLRSDTTNGLDVDVTRVSGTVTVDGSGVTQPVSHAALTELAAAINSDKVDVNVVSGAISLPTGASTLAEQQTQTTHLATIAGDTTDIETAVELIDDAIVADDAAFTPATTKVMMAGFEFDDTTPDTVDEGDAGAARMSSRREVYTQIRDAAGNERGLNIDANGELGVSAIRSALPAGTNAIGKLAANSGVDIGDVDVTSSALPTGASTSAKQDTIIGHLDGVEGLLTTIDGDTGTLASTVATISATPLTRIAIFDDNDTQITSFGGGTQYTEDAAAAANPVGTALIMVRDDALSGQTSDDGDNIAGRGTDKGELYVKHVDAIPVTDNGGALTVDGTVAVSSVGGTVAVTQSGTWDEVGINDSGNSITVDNGGTFAVQVDGDALTSLQLIDDAVATLGTSTYTETTTKGLTIGAVRRDADTTLVNTTNEIGPLQMDANGRLKVEAFSGETLPVSLASVPSHAVTNAGTFAVQESGGALTALQIMDDWDNGASDGASVSGDVAHDTADAGEPVKMGMKAVALKANPTEVAAGDRTNWYADVSGVPFVLGGHPNVLTQSMQVTDADGAQTDAAIITAAANVAIVLTKISVMADNANTTDVSVRIGFGTANTPAADAAQVVLFHPGLAAGSGIVEGNGAGIIGIGASGEDLRITCEDPVSGSINVIATYFTTDI